MIEGIIHEQLLQKLDRNAPISLSRQIYQVLSQLILDGVLIESIKLPSTRALAKDLGVSRNTIIEAYDQLLAEGYIESYTGSGTYVSKTVPDKNTHFFGVSESAFLANDRIIISGRGKELLNNAQAAKKQWGAFVSGVPDVKLFPSEIWLKLLRRHWRKPSSELMTYSHGAGYYPLREALCAYLRIARSVYCEPEQVVITGGVHQALSTISLLLGDIGDKVWMEDPGYWGASTVLRASGLNLEPIAVDEEGIAPSSQQVQAPPKFIFVTPSHQYPLGYVLSLARRRMLLEYAYQHSAWIIEDDYDSEFRFEGQPIASLQGLDVHGRVLYLGTFSKTLFPSLRLGFIVVPKHLAQPVAKCLSELYREGRLIEQAALADFIIEGYYASHIRKMRGLYARRQSILREVIYEHFGNDWPLSNQEAGLHLVMHLPPEVDDKVIAEQASKRGIWVRPLSKYYVNSPGASGLLFGYATVHENEIAPSFKKVAKIIKRALS